MNSVGTKKILGVKRALVAACLAAAVVAATVPAQAQSASRIRRESNQNRKNRIQRTVDETYSHRYEAGGGGGFLRFRSGSNLQQSSEVSFWANNTYYLDRKLGITGQVNGSYGNAKLGNNGLIQYNPKISEYTFMAGPTYRFRMREKYALSVFVTGGLALGKFDGDSKGFTSQDFQDAGYHLWNSGYSGAVSAGVNFDYNFYPNLALRISPLYKATTFGGSVQNNKGFDMGLVYRFGKLK
ncbi:hypothetical protein FTO74_03205 [Granulicella sp. WH15]|uniref:outer membrane protein n=1 Tax=Granulicella sp. WH15 TaxID=2602070 RepID=UPI001366A1A4|nr:hypothetical protein [Granulicella sp. WH15]QHN02491.1 hypothetical protein FTO74_03205 [Granulicella sp. WH15]